MELGKIDNNQMKSQLSEKKLEPQDLNQQLQVYILKQEKEKKQNVIDFEIETCNHSQNFKI